MADILNSGMIEKNHEKECLPARINKEKKLYYNDTRPFNILEDYDFMVEEFIKFKKLNNLRPGTIRAYNDFLTRQFRKYMMEHKDFVDAYNAMLKHHIDEGYSGSAIKRDTNIVKNFGRHFNITDVKYLANYRLEKKEPVYVTPNDFEKIMENVENEHTRMTFDFIYNTGLRISEAVNVRVDDFYPEENYIHVRKGKGGKERKVVVSDDLLERCADYVEKTLGIRYLCKNGRCDYFLLAERNNAGEKEPIDKNTISNRFRDARKKAGIKKHITPHSLRHGYATRLLAQGVNIRVIQEQLGHADLTMTNLYTHISPKFRKEQMDNFLDMDKGMEEMKNNLNQNNQTTEMSNGLDLNDKVLDVNNIDIQDEVEVYNSKANRINSELTKPTSNGNVNNDYASMFSWNSGYDNVINHTADSVNHNIGSGDKQNEENKDAIISIGDGNKVNIDLDKLSPEEMKVIIKLLSKQ